jgi:hypothetical protein
LRVDRREDVDMPTEEPYSRRRNRAGEPHVQRELQLEVN